MSNQSTFDNIFASIDNEIAYDTKWANGTGYFDRAVTEVKLGEGERAKFTDDSGRRGILVGTAVGTCVFFERYVTSGDGRCGVIVTNVPKQLNAIIPSGSIHGDLLFNMAGMKNQNIGTVVQWIVDSVNKAA